MKGLTLIELMISIALFIIFMSLGIPGFGNLVDRHKANTSTHALKRILAHSRIIALEKGRYVTTCPIQNNKCSSQWRGIITAFEDLNDNQQIDEDEHQFLSSELHLSHGYWQKKREKKPYVLFNPQGHAFSSATTFLYCPFSKALKHAKLLAISFQGRVRADNYMTPHGSINSRVAPLNCAD